MKLSDKTEEFSMGNKTFKGKYKKCECNIYYSRDGYWYYLCFNVEDTIRFNSLWDNLRYSTKEECHDACVKYIDDKLKQS